MVSIFTPSETAGKVFETGLAKCTGSSVVDAEAEGNVLLCDDCAGLERPGVNGTSSRVSVGESARSKRYIFFSTYKEISKVVKGDEGTRTERICLPEMIFFAFSSSGLSASTKTS